MSYVVYSKTICKILVNWISFSVKKNVCVLSAFLKSVSVPLLHNVENKTRV